MSRAFNFETTAYYSTSTIHIDISEFSLTISCMNNGVKCRNR